MARSGRLLAQFHGLLLLCLALSLAAPAAPAAARPAAATGAAPAASGDAALGPAVTGLPGVPDGAREVLAKRTRTARTTDGPQNYQDSTGAWQPIDDTLVPDGTGGYATKADGYAAHLPASLAAGPVSVALGSRSVSFSLVGASGAAAVHGAVASYPNALPGVTVAYAAGGDGLAEDLTLASPAAPRTFVYTLAATGLTAHANAAGGVDFVDASGTVPLAFAPPVMVDAAHARSRAAALTLGRGPVGPAVTLAAEPAWLAAPARKWPVVLDPALVINAYGTQDCYLDSYSPTTSYCGANELVLGSQEGTPYLDHTLLQFNVGPTANQLLGAEVGLYWIDATTRGQFTLDMHQVTRPWTTAATWNTADGSTAWTSPGGDYNPTPASQAAVSTNIPGWVLWDPTSPALGWNAGTIANFGLLAKHNGRYAFESALHVLPLAAPAATMELGRWNSPELWRGGYGPSADGHLFFAEDVFGVQFTILDGRICRFDPETGVSTTLAASLDEWAGRVLAEYALLTGYPLAHAWQAEHGAMPAGSRLLPKRPFALGGEFAVDNLYALDAVQGRRLRAELADQIRDLPDGTAVRRTAGER